MTPYLDNAPWPCMRGGTASLGRGAEPTPSDLPLRHFRTGGPVFSTPVIGPAEQIYVGSADRSFYRLDPASGAVIWKRPTGEIIDSAACLGPDGTVWVPGGDGCLYGLRSDDGAEVWRYDRPADASRYTPSTIYWWEGNAVMGPNGWIYAGNDDFYLYAIEPFRGVRWAVPTGLHIWAAPAFDDRHVYAASFDRCLYALDPQTGAVRWRANLGNFIASSPAVAGDLVVVGSFDGSITAVEAATGRQRWRTMTGGPVYASVAVGDDALFVGSADGTVYALDRETGRVRWTWWLGETIRGSAAVVGDRVVVPGGDGRIVCLSTDGGCQWIYDTRVASPGARAVNLNASIAVGRHGIATASASGEVIYLPWTLDPATPGLSVGEPAAVDGVSLRAVPAGGVATGERLVLHPGDVVGVRVVHREGGAVQPVHLESATASSGRVLVSPDGGQVNVEAPEEPLRIEITYRIGAVVHRVDQRVDVTIAPPVQGELPATFRVARMSVQSPSIVPSFDQIGLASLHIDVGVLEERGGRVLAWGVQRFGLDEQGAAVGVPDGRVLYYPFCGTWRDGALVLEARDVLFEITSFPVPLDRLRLTAHLEGSLLVGATLLAETDGRDARRFVKNMARPAVWPRRPRDLGALGRIARRALPVAVALYRGMWRPWGLLDERLRFNGVGSFEIESVPATPGALHLSSLTRVADEVVAVFDSPPRTTDAPALLFLDGERNPVGTPRDLRPTETGVVARVPAGAVEAWALLGVRCVGQLRL